MTELPVSHEFRGSPTSEWHRCTPERALVLGSRAGYEVRALYINTRSERESRLDADNHILAGQAARQRIRVRLAMTYLRSGDTEAAMRVLSLVCENRP